jgi:RimJ/RimL family protein N-acetyltransferase
VLEASTAAFDADQEWSYFVIEPSTTELVGGSGLHRRAAPDTVEIGYWVRSDRTNRGYATAAAAALAEAAFVYLPEVQHVEIHMDKANLASAAVPPKAGFRFEREEIRECLAPGHTGSGFVWVRDRQPD